MDKKRDSIQIEFEFTNAEIGKPMHAKFTTGCLEKLTPNTARLIRMSYTAPLSLQAKVKLTAQYSDGNTITKSVDIPKFQVSNNMPIMIRSTHCHTHKLSREALKGIKEDPNEPGGYFIIGGQEYSVELLENIKFNVLHVHRDHYKGTILRGEFISQDPTRGAFRTVYIRHAKKIASWWAGSRMAPLRFDRLFRTCACNIQAIKKYVRAFT